MCSAFCSALGSASSSPGKSCADIYQVNKASRDRSGYYWVNNTSPVRVYCDIELVCGGVKGGWTRIAILDMSQDNSCHSPRSPIVMPGTSIKVCQSPGCYSVTYPLTTTRSVVKLQVTKKELPMVFTLLIHTTRDLSMTCTLMGYR